MNPKDIIRFMDKVKIIGSCWEWQGAKNNAGYGQFRNNSKWGLAHRFSYELFKGDIPPNLVLDHLCRNRKCVNTEHLEAVTNKENLLQGNGVCAKNARKTHCKSGHEFNKENTYVYPNGRGRKCKICQEKFQTEYQMRLKNLS